MSDPVTNAEVEDVLSSIRRLVSEDKRPHAVAPSPAPAPAAAAPALDDRLVLTPALRVAANDAPKVAPEPVADTQEAIDAALAAARADGAFADDVAVLASRDAAAPEDADADATVFTEDDFDWDEEIGAIKDAKPLLLTPEDSETEVDTDSSYEEGATEEPTVDDIQDATAKAGSLSAKIAALETAIGSISQEWEPDDAGTDAYSGTDAPAMEWEDDDTVLDAKGHVLRSVATEPETLEDADFEAEADVTPQQDVSKLDDVTSQNDAADMAAEMAAGNALEDAQVDLDDAADRDAADRDAADRDAADTDAELDAADAPIDDLAADAEDQLIDEDMLRDLVGDIVRAELQGALGERITRNVRKLVRREIRRALAAQELE